MVGWIASTPAQKNAISAKHYASVKASGVKRAASEMDRIAAALKFNQDELKSGTISERRYNRRRADLVAEFNRHQTLYVEAFGAKYDPPIFSAAR